MTDLRPRDRLLARIASMQATRARGIDFTAGLCAVALVCATFAASGASYTPVVDFNMAHRLSTGLIRDPLSIIGTLGTGLSGLIALLALAQGRIRPTLIALASIAFCAYTLLSITWGVFSISAAGEGIKGIAFVIAIPYCIETLGPRRSAVCVLYTLLAILLGSAFLCVTDKRFATDGYAVVHLEWRSTSDVLGWRGLFTQKNWLAMSCLSTLLFQIFTFRQFRRSLSYWFLAALTLVLLYESKGKTAELVSLIVLGSVTVLFINRRFFRIDMRVIVFLGIGLLLAFIFASYTGMILKGFDWTFTHRLGIWEEYWKLSTQRPFFGYGSGGTWQEDEIFGELRQNAKGMTSAHNSYLAMLFSGGFTALALFALWLFAVLREVFTGSADWYSKVVAFFAVVGGLLLAMFEAMFSPNIANSFAAFILFFGLTYMRGAGPAPPPRAAAPARVAPRARARRPTDAPQPAATASPARR